jgi:excisionase family DNA binding protein
MVGDTEPQSQANGGWLSVTEAALRLGITDRTVRAWADKALLGSRKVGSYWQIDEASVQARLATKTRPGKVGKVGKVGSGPVPVAPEFSDFGSDFEKAALRAEAAELRLRLMAETHRADAAVLNASRWQNALRAAMGDFDRTGLDSTT